MENLTLADKVEKLREKLEFWMGDSNLPRDKFLMKFVENNDGWIPVGSFLKFNSVKSLGVKEIEPLVSAIKKIGFLDLKDDNKSVKRNTPLPTKEDMIARLDRVILFKILPENKVDPEFVKKQFERFGKVLYFSLSSKKPKKPSAFDGSAELATAQQIADFQKWDKKFKFGPEKAEFSIEAAISGEIQREKKEKSRKELLKGFAPEKVFEVRGFPASLKFFQLRKILDAAVSAVGTEGQAKEAEPKPEGEAKGEAEGTPKKAKTGEGATKESEPKAEGGKTKEPKTGRSPFNGEIFAPSDEKADKVGPYAIFRISGSTELTAAEVKAAVGPREGFELEISVFEDQKEAEEKWIKAVTAFREERKKSGGKGRFKKWKRKR